MKLLIGLILAQVAFMGAGVVFTREPMKQVLALSYYGILLALMFFLLQAPDVALSQIVIGAVALPLMVVLALSKTKGRLR